MRPGRRLPPKPWRPNPFLVPLQEPKNRGKCGNGCRCVALLAPTVQTLEPGSWIRLSLIVGVPVLEPFQNRSQEGNCAWSKFLLQ